MGIVKNIAINGKDKVVSASLRKFLQPYMKDIGHIKELKIDSDKKIISLYIELNGEHCPVHIVASDYEIIQETGRTYLVISKISTSRQWLTIVAETYLIGKRFELPEKYSPIIGILA